MRTKFRELSCEQTAAPSMSYPTQHSNVSYLIMFRIIWNIFMNLSQELAVTRVGDFVSSSGLSYGTSSTLLFNYGDHMNAWTVTSQSSTCISGRLGSCLMWAQGRILIGTMGRVIAFLLRFLACTPDSPLLVSINICKTIIFINFYLKSGLLKNNDFFLKND